MTTHIDPLKEKFSPDESAIKKFWSLVEKTESCWIWKGYINRYGYFSFNSRSMKSHRFSFLIHGGILTSEKPCVLHNCPDGDNPACVNPSHLWAGSQHENILDMESKGRAKHPRGAESGAAKHPESVARGIKNHNAKLTDEMVLEIFKTCKNAPRGTKQKTADRIGVSRGLIGHIVNGRAWNHITKLPKIKSANYRSPANDDSPAK